MIAFSLITNEGENQAIYNLLLLSEKDNFKLETNILSSFLNSKRNKGMRVYVYKQYIISLKKDIMT